ncbi:MAG: hypothetical protein SVM80_09900 [Halobacteriota archaeon]|nr:hypothetical protein [Halobacteriota archaeon]
MSKVLEKRRSCLELTSKLTRDKGYFTIQEVVDAIGIPRSTAQDWINRLKSEGCIELVEEGSGRRPARYIRTMRRLPTSACNRIFTTVDGDTVEIIHECRSEGGAAFCEYEHGRSGGAVIDVKRDGVILRERAIACKREVEVGRYPKASVGITEVRIEGELVAQRLKCFGGPAYSLTEMMQSAHGVLDVRIKRPDDYIEGEILTEAMEHVIIGVDDTDREGEGATFALTLSLLDKLSSLAYVERIGHKVGFLNPKIQQKTAGNAASIIELGVKSEKLDAVLKTAVTYLEKETLSERTGMAIRVGFKPIPELTRFASKAREGEVTVDEALKVARLSGVDVIEVTGRLGIIGAVAALGLSNFGPDVLMDPHKVLIPYS